jgi:hypothetical protein
MNPVAAVSTLPAQRATGRPVLLSAEGRAPLERLRLGGVSGHDEAWLQELLFDCPDILPVHDIEPAFGQLVPLAREVACSQGFIDNLYITARGEIVLAEVKLWANPQSRREVVAQALDYAAALTLMGYEAFEASVLAALPKERRPASLYQHLADVPEMLPEAAFVDAVSANLARGRILVLAVGDGIRSETEVLAGLLQRHAGAHFTFALVELATWRSGDTLLVVPTTLLKTVMIERGIVSLRDDRMMVSAPSLPAGKAAARGRSLSGMAFHEALGAVDPALPSDIQAFVASLEPIGVVAEQLGSLNLKFDPGDGNEPVRLGFIRKNGTFDTSSVGWGLETRPALQPLSGRYLRSLAALIGGEVLAGDGWSGQHLALGGRPPSVRRLLDHADDWREAIRAYVHDARMGIDGAQA